jgi:hypothetical protein
MVEGESAAWVEVWYRHTMQVLAEVASILREEMQAMVVLADHLFLQEE